MVTTMKEARKAIKLLNYGYVDTFDIITKTVKLYTYKSNQRDTTTYWVSTGGQFMKQIPEPYGKRHFIYINGQDVTGPLTNYKLIKEVEYLDYLDGNGRDVVQIMTGQKGQWIG